jgi:bidirectional [NiFe] hydrogenase diaphorase subunit
MDVRLRIDGMEATAPAGTSLLDLARRAGCGIPALCHHEAVPAIAACRLCLVEVRRPGRSEAALTTSCDYPVSADLEVVTDSPLIRKHRAMNLQLLLPYAPVAPVLQELAVQLGVTHPLFPPVAGAPLPGCILCELCVRVCGALGYHALAALGRGDHKRVGPPFGQAAADACVGCGACHSVCPTNCIPMEDGPTTRTIWGRTFDLFACRRCHTPFMTEAHRAATAARGDLPEGYYDLCEACKQAATGEQLATAAR